MNKEEKIQEAYGEHWELFKDKVSNDGWTVKSLLPYMVASEIQFINSAQRPLSLQGIENKTIYKFL